VINFVRGKIFGGSSNLRWGSTSHWLWTWKLTCTTSWRIYPAFCVGCWCIWAKSKSQFRTLNFNVAGNPGYSAHKYRHSAFLLLNARIISPSTRLRTQPASMQNVWKKDIGRCCGSCHARNPVISQLTRCGYSPVDVRLVDNKQYFASVAVRRRPLVVGLSADPAKSSRSCRRHLPAERRMGGDGRRATLRRRPGDITVAVCWWPAGRARPWQVILQVAGAESSTEEVNPRRDVVSKAWVRNFGGLHNLM